MIALDDKRWSSLQTHSGNGDWIPQWLRRLLQSPNDLSLFRSDSWGLYSQEITCSGAFATAPYLVELARRAQTEARLEYVCFLGLVAMYRLPPETAESLGECPADLEESFRDAIAAAFEMATELLQGAVGEPDVRCLLTAIAAFKGFPGLARNILELQHEQRQDMPNEEIPF